MIKATIYFENGANPGAIAEAQKALPEPIHDEYDHRNRYYITPQVLVR